MRILKCALSGFLFLTLLITINQLNSDPLTNYMYITDLEHAPNERIIWFWTPDTMYGRVHSNDYIGLKYSPHFYGPVSTAKERFHEFQASPYFGSEPQFNVRPVYFPENFAHIRQMANVEISSLNNQMITWIQLRGEDGVDIYQHPRGIDVGDSLIRHVDLHEDYIIYVDGEVEIAGELVGRLTVCSSGDMGLLDDVRYQGSDMATGWFDENEMAHMLALLSERNILIKDSDENGKANGYEDAPNNRNRHSIVINGSLIALNESFTFEHQNYHWEFYQGPRPDERGYIFLKGSLAQKRRGYTHLGNHDGTGYLKSYNYDFRLSNTYPPGLAAGDYDRISGSYDRLELGGQRAEYTLDRVEVNTLVVHAGTELVLAGVESIIVRDSLIIQGTLDNPVIFRAESHGQHQVVRVDRNIGSAVNLAHANFSSEIEARIVSVSIQIDNCQFGASVSINGDVALSHCTFASEVSLVSYHDLEVGHCVFENGLSVSGNFQDGEIVNNTFVCGYGTGLRIRGQRGLSVVNNIITGNREGILNDHYDAPTLAYNNVFDNRDNYIDCEAGAGSISVDPGFVDAAQGDYHLLWGSPCIDSGSPDLPQDADGSRSDMGAYAFNHEDPRGADAENETAAPLDFALHEPFPNPFNPTTTVTYDIAKDSQVLLTVRDVRGSLTSALVNEAVTAGFHELQLNCDNLPAGVYFVNLQIGASAQAKKIVLLR